MRSTWKLTVDTDSRTSVTWTLGERTTRVRSELVVRGHDAGPDWASRTCHRLEWSHHETLADCHALLDPRVVTTLGMSRSAETTAASRISNRCQVRTWSL